MNVKKYLLALAAAAAVSVCLAGCGGSDDSGANSGSVSLTTTSSPEADSGAATTAPEESAPDDATTTEEPHIPDSSLPDDLSDNIRTAARISYNGKEFGVGDNIKDIASELGDEAGPPQQVESCMTGNPEVVYYYSNLNIHTSTEGVIYSIDLGMDALYPGDVGATRDGVRAGSSFEEAKALLGEPTSTDDYNYYYEEGTLKLQLSASYEDDNKIGSVSVTDTSFN